MNLSKSVSNTKKSELDVEFSSKLSRTTLIINGSDNNNNNTYEIMAQRQHFLLKFMYTYIICIAHFATRPLNRFENKFKYQNSLWFGRAT